jgi:hypothetical protein
MKKLHMLAVLVLALPTALLAQVQFSPNTLAFGPYQATTGPLGLTPGYWIFYGAFPENGTISAIEGNVLIGDALSPTVGLGIGVDAGVVSISGIGVGIGYTITPNTDADGNSYIVLNTSAIYTPFSETHVENIGFDNPAVNMTPQQAVDAVNSGQISQSLFNAFFNGSSPSWQATAISIANPPPSSQPQEDFNDSFDDSWSGDSGMDDGPGC